MNVAEFGTFVSRYKGFPVRFCVDYLEAIGFKNIECFNDYTTILEMDNCRIILKEIHVNASENQDIAVIDEITWWQRKEDFF